VFVTGEPGIGKTTLMSIDGMKRLTPSLNVVA
jgi:nucleoside-triphosphatase THEP1